MNPERWQQIERIYHAALERSPEQRNNFLMAACEGDAQLHSEVESLLLQDLAPDNLLERPACEAAGSLFHDVSAAGLPSGAQLGPYRVESLIGVGGMGTVYRGRDTRLNRPVAIKVCAQRFLSGFAREARLISTLNHPNVCALYDVGSDYMVLELVEGLTLSERIRQRPVPVQEALAIAAQIAAALEAAHELGIVHRDLKPANIKITSSGLVKVLDFGLAKRIGLPPGSAGGGDSLTESYQTHPGLILGTVAYMSPEQARGLTVDKRTDIWAFGCVLFEMLTRKRAFEGETATDTLAAVLAKQPDWNALPKSTPNHIRRLLDRCLNKDPAKRPQHTSEVRLAVQAPGAAGKIGFVLRRRWRRAAIPAAIVCLMVATGYWGMQKSSIRSIAVLPFVNETGEPANEYLTDGVAEELINNISLLPHVNVRSRSTAFRYKGKDVDPQQAGKNLKVDAVLVGRMALRRDEFSLSAELVDTSTDRHIWGERYDRKLSDLADVERQITDGVSGKLHAPLTPGEQKKIQARMARSSDAYQLYLRGRYEMYRFTEDSARLAIQYFEQAIAKDPTYAEPYCGLADTYVLYSELYLPGAASAIRARNAVEQALKLDDSLAEGHTTLGMVHYWYDWNWAAAEKEFRRAIELNPNYALAHEQYGWLLIACKRFEEAGAEFDKAIQLEPVSLLFLGDPGQLELVRRHYESAISHARKAVEIDPNFASGHNLLGTFLTVAGHTAEGITELERARSLDERNPYTTAMLAYAYFAAGQRTRARLLARQLEANQHVYPAAIAIAYLGLKDIEQALHWLEKARDARAPAMVLLNTDPILDPLRSQPRFQALLSELNFPK
ncbi:MAG TPA: protein kinase [Bryobacteraceae bacterium]|jgi:serine/threonine protein kinase/Tfp pilus assembly protein PilF|nr:protein kinase [Bryobacteraceae bacterium]